MSAIAGSPKAFPALSESRKLRIGSMAIFYFAQGLPMGLFLIAVAGWLAANDRPADEVAAIVAMAYLPWSGKFIIAALIDRYTWRSMGRKRPWIVASQIVTLTGLAAAAALDPTPSEANWLAWLGFVILLGAAIQDSAVDGLAVEILADEEQGTASAYMYAGQTLGVAGGSMLGGHLLEGYGGSMTFLAFAPFTIATFALALMLRERPGEKLLPWTSGQAHLSVADGASDAWRKIVSTTLVALVRRDSVILIAGTLLASATAGALTAFWPIFAVREAGYSTASYSSLIAIVGLACAIACVWIGIFMTARLGARNASILAIAGFAVVALPFLADLQFAANGAVFVALTVGWVMTDTLKSICINPLRMRLSDKRVAATQFTIYTSLSNLGGVVGAALLAITVGGDDYTLLLAIVIGLALASGGVFRLMRVGKVPEPAPDAGVVA